MWTEDFKKATRDTGSVRRRAGNVEEGPPRVPHCLLVKRHRVNNLAAAWSDWFLRGPSGPMYSDELGRIPKKFGSSNYADEDSSLHLESAQRRR